jgi:endonuclease/exonuclease/phosphatase family metal-dependent hydrolase
MNIRVQPIREIPSSRRCCGLASWCAAVLASASFLFAAVPQAAAQAKPLPGIVEAEDFDNGANGSAYYDTTPGNTGGRYRATDVDIEDCIEGGYNIGWVYPGEWLKYTVNVAAAGTYNLDLRVATPTGGTVHVEFNGANLTGAVTVPATGGWQVWTTIRKTVSLAAGTQVMRVAIDAGNVNLNYYIVSVPGTPRSLPGTIEAEDFDNGANGSAYYDTTPGNTGGRYRSTDVDIEDCVEGGYNVGWVVAGEWLKYTVNVAAAGTYTLDLRVASAIGGSMHVEFNGTNVTGAVSVPFTGGWQTWTTIRKTVSLAAGTQVMRVAFDSGDLNLNWIAASSGGSASTPFGGAPMPIPGWIQAADFDNGGPGVAYFDTTPGNLGGAYRATDVDIEYAPGGYAIDWVDAGEWLKYTVNVAADGNYTVVARVASFGGGGTFHIEFNGADRTGPMRVPNTGGWQSYQDLIASVSLSAGVQVMRIVFDSNGSSGAVGNVSAIRFDAATTIPPGGRLRLMTWNISFGGANSPAQAQVIASSGADVVAMQEASTYDENMPVTYTDRLRQLTGQTWYSAWGPSLASGASQGTLILSRFPIVNSQPAVLDGTGLVRALIDVGGVRVQVFAIHLEYYDTAKRTRQLNLLMDWARQYAEPTILAGDFNSWWGEWWIQTTKTEYSDTWEDVTGSVQNGYTLNGSVRFDYLFRAHKQNQRLTPTACWVTVPALTLSDHWPVTADFTVR